MGILYLVYGVLCWLMFVATLMYAMFFVGDFVVPFSVNMNPYFGGAPILQSVLINFGFLALFSLQHSIMARPKFKSWWTKVIPDAIERSTFILFANSILILMYYYWHPIPNVIWRVEAQWAQILLWAIFGIGWAMVFASASMIDYFELTGLKQVWYAFKGKEMPGYTFGTPYLYSVIRHPIYFGFLLGSWSIPTMTGGHLVWSIGATIVIAIGVKLEERNLVDYFGAKYVSYKKRVPMLIPFLKF